jgi:sporulation protein YlmC with PRC-barrel domain
LRGSREATLPEVEPGLRRVSDLLGAEVYDESGRSIGRIADLITDDAENPAVVAALVTRPPWGRLLGYERESATGPKLLELFARATLRRNSRRVEWRDLRL